MGTQDYRATYRVAMQEATSELNEIYREVDELQVRREMIEQALEAIEPFLSRSEVSYAATSNQERRREPLAAQPVRVELSREVVAPIAAAAAPVNEPVTPAPFAPVPDLIVDPIQSRINRALGLAVA